MKKEIPILFSTAMVQAILEGRKTQTRRIINPQPIIDKDSGFVFDGKHKKQYSIYNWKESFIDDFSRWMPEDLLWVRESFNVEQYPVAPEGDHDELLYYYKATEKEFTDMRWKPSIHMPKEASRIWLEVSNIKVERLHEINSNDVVSEGAGREVRQMWLYGLNSIERDGIYRLSYKKVWESINGEESWKGNPWVWVIEFKRLSKIGKLI